MKKDVRAVCKQWLEMGMEGLIPIYGKDGRNGTLIVFENKPSIEDQRRLCTILDGLACLYQKSIDLVKKQARDITGQRTMNPLPLFPMGILVPFRMRKPIGRDDGAVGYFFYHAIDQVIETENGTQLILKDGQAFTVLDSITSSRRRIHCACQIRDRLCCYEIGIDRVYGRCMEWEDFYNQPATRADIAMLSRDLAALVKIIGR